ncbi:CPBP family intramembrane glutamic endopeptidase [Propionibacteriaceae bacterium Y1685]|uniref:CPBP family intramembrane glutamic endopeptidase n=1 Tax=Microlunatus sp. Y1700 TaxID=3418487 RepID=UPI003B78C27C
MTAPATERWSLTPDFPSAAVRTHLPRALLITEMVLLLGVSLGRSAIWSITSLVEKLTRPDQPLNQQTTSMNTSQVPDRPWLDLIYQVLGFTLPVIPALLALHLLSVTFVGVRSMIGFDLRRPGRDLLLSLGIAAGIGIPGLGLYLGARALGLNTNIAAANLTEHWWTVPVLIGLAMMNGILEEVIMLGWWFVRARQVGMSWAWVIISSALIRASYHLYQGFGGFIGNLIMGLIFGVIFLKCRRVMPLVITHILIDIAAFVGYTLISPYVTWL